MISPTNILVPQIIGPGLLIGIGPGLVWFGGSSVNYAEAFVGLHAQSTNFVYLDFSSGLIVVNLTGFPSNCFPIATVTTGSTNVVSLVDVRPDLISGVGGGGGGSGPTYRDNEVPTGNINGVNNIFTLGLTPSPSASVELFLNGLLLQQGTDYTLSGFTLTLSSPPAIGDVLIAFYRALGSGGGPNFSDAEVPGGAVNGTNVTFTVANVPNPRGSLQLYLNGVLQQQGTDYTISGLTITFASAPAVGDVLNAFYRF